MRKALLGLCLLSLSPLPPPAAPAPAQDARPELSRETREFVTVDAPAVALTHVRVIDGTGAPARPDQTVVISGGRVQSVGPSASARVPEGAKVLDLAGRSVIPGLVLMHEHLFYPTGRLSLFNEMGWSFPRLYLGSGVTTMRTAGSVEPYTDLNIKRLIDTGRIPGPRVRVTGPYLDGKGATATQFRALDGPDSARRMVSQWADEGVTSFKAYMHISRAELGAAIEEAHKRNIKVTGHLCSVGFREAAALGIDNLEHGMIVNTEFIPGKRPDVCPPQNETVAHFARLDLNSAPVRETIRDLVARKVAVTSTLAVFEAFLPDRPPLQQRVLDAMTADARTQYLASRARAAERKDSPWAAALKKEMEFELAFVRAGGRLMAGTDPTGNGGALAGFGSQRAVILLVEAGFTPLEAIRISTLNAAEFLGEAEHLGSVAPGKLADLVVLRGDPSANINDIEKVELVFKDGLGYDPARLVDSVRGSVGWR